VIRHIHILNASRLDDRDLLLAAEAAGREYGAPAGVERISLGFDRAFDPSRGQYRSGILLAEVLSGSSSPDEKRIAVVDVDLFVPVLTFVFGEAQLEGLAAIVSTHRLSDEFYGLKGDRRRLLERLEKEVVHELGHTAGLAHCRQFECVMRSSTYVEEIDLKKGSLCSECRARVVNATSIRTGELL
jgi:archaemetzincin